MRIIITKSRVRNLQRLFASLGTATAFLFNFAAHAAPPPDQPPLPHAIRVISLSPDNSTAISGMVGSVIQPWLSDHEVLHFRRGQLYRYDVASRTQTLPQFGDKYVPHTSLQPESEVIFLTISGIITSSRNDSEEKDNAPKS